MRGSRHLAPTAHQKPSRGCGNLDHYDITGDSEVYAEGFDLEQPLNAPVTFPVQVDPNGIPVHQSPGSSFLVGDISVPDSEVDVTETARWNLRLVKQ